MDGLDSLSVLVIAVALSADCFAVAFSGSISMQRITPFQITRTALSFGLFQAMMPVLPVMTTGWLLFCWL